MLGCALASAIEWAAVHLSASENGQQCAGQHNRVRGSAPASAIECVVVHLLAPKHTHLKIRETEQSSDYGSRHVECGCHNAVQNARATAMTQSALRVQLP